MKGLFSMLGLDEGELTNAMQKFTALFEAVDRIESKLDELLSQRNDVEDVNDGNDD